MKQALLIFCLTLLKSMVGLNFDIFTFTTFPSISIVLFYDDLTTKRRLQQVNVSLCMLKTCCTILSQIQITLNHNLNYHQLAVSVIQKLPVPQHDTKHKTTVMPSLEFLIVQNYQHCPGNFWIRQGAQGVTLSVCTTQSCLKH